VSEDEASVDCVVHSVLSYDDLRSQIRFVTNSFTYNSNASVEEQLLCHSRNAGQSTQAM
jgi:hypothetical protein